MKTFALTCLATMVAAHKGKWKDNCSGNQEGCTISDVNFQSIGSINFDYASYLEVTKWNNEDFMLISEFEGAPWKSGSVAIVPGLKEGVMNGDVSDLKAHTLDPSPYKFENPNNSKKVPDDVFDGELVVLVPDGFVIWGHRDGGVYLLVQDKEDITKTTKTVKLTKHISDKFYHTGHWIDMNQDGRKDLLIARADSKRRTNGGELVWLEHPAEGALDGEWVEHVICNGPDVYTSVDVLPQYPNEIVVWAS
jgi:hypothetical protein